MSATTTLMTSTALPHDPQQHVPDRPNTPRPSTPPSTSEPAQPPPSPPSPPTPNALLHPPIPLTQQPTEKDIVEDRSSSPMELEDSLDDTDINTDAAMSDFAHEIDSDADYLAEDLMNDLRRVKVYELVNQTWKDLGTAFCTGDYDDAAGAQLVAKTEDTKEVVLQISIRAEEVYQRQADTLIVWQELDGKDYALSFQDLEGCSEVWDFIQEVRKHLRSLDEPGSSPPYPEYPPASGVHIGQLPTPTLANIRDIERSLKTVVRSAPVRERIAENIVSTDFVRELVKLMHDAEDLESLPDLHALCNLMQTILMLNDQNIYEYVLRDDMFVDMVGILEYDPDFPTHKACYRDFLKDNMHYREVIHFREPAIRVKVHQTYRLQYLKDVVLARVLDDPTFNILNSFIIFNQIDIVNYIQNEEYFLHELFRIFHPQMPSALPSNGSEVSMNTAEPDQDQRKEETDERKAVALLLLHQFCSMGKNIQLPMRIPLFRSLVDRSVLHPVQWAFEHTDVKIRNIGGEILTAILDHDAGGVRGHILRQYDQIQSPTLLHRMSTMLASPLELGFRTQLAESYRTLMDVPGADHTNVSASSLNTITTSNHSPDSPPPSNTGPTPVSPPSASSFLNGLQQFLKNPFSPSPPPSNSPPPTDAHSPSTDAPSPHPPQQLPGIKVTPKKEDAQSEKFVDYFYKNCAEELFKPFSGVVDHEEVKDEDVPLRLGREQSDPFLYLCDLLSGFLLQHSYQSHFFVLTSNISAKVATLLYAREKHLRLSALRFFRTCLRLNNNNLLNHLKKHRVFLPILKLTLRESKRDNLLSSCCQEMFEAIRRENYRDLIDHIMTNYESLIKELSESAIMGQRFIGLIKRWEINNEPPPRFEPIAAPQPRKWGQVRLTDAEDDYFNGASDDDAPASPTAQRGRAQRGMPLRRGGGGKRPSRPTNVAIPKSFPIGGIALVDYQEDDEPTDGAAVPFQDSPRPRRTRRDIGNKNEVMRTTSSTNLAELSGSTSPSSGSQGVAGGLTRTKSVADLSPMAIEEDGDLIGLPVPLSYKRRREEDEEEGLERLAKRPALAGKEKEKGRERSSERVSQRTRAVSPAPSRSAADEVAEGSGSGRTAGSGTPSQKLRLKVRLGGKSAGPPPQGSPPPHTSVKVGDKG